MFKLNNTIYLKGKYNNHIVFFSCLMQDLRNQDLEVQICWIENQGEVKVDYVKIGEIQNISEEKLTD